jgi:hypothetical protein
MINKMKEINRIICFYQEYEKRELEFEDLFIKYKNNNKEYSYKLENFIKDELFYLTSLSTIMYLLAFIQYQDKSEY